MAFPICFGHWKISQKRNTKRKPDKFISAQHPLEEFTENCLTRPQKVDLSNAMYVGPITRVLEDYFGSFGLQTETRAANTYL